MPALRTLIDGVPLATVSGDEYEFLFVHVSGSRLDRALATIEVTGSTCSEHGQFIYLIWAFDVELLPHQEVTVQFLEQAQTSHPGKTIAEQYPNEPPCEETDFTLTPEMFAALRAKPSCRDGFRLFLESSQGARVQVETMPEDHGFEFHVMWNSFEPTQARMSLHSYTLQSMEARMSGNYYVQEKMRYGDEVKIRLADQVSAVGGDA